MLRFLHSFIPTDRSVNKWKFLPTNLKALSSWFKMWKRKVIIKIVTRLPKSILEMPGRRDQKYWRRKMRFLLDDAPAVFVESIHERDEIGRRHGTDANSYAPVSTRVLRQRFTDRHMKLPFFSIRFFPKPVSTHEIVQHRMNWNRVESRTSRKRRRRYVEHKWPVKWTPLPDFACASDSRGIYVSLN